MNNSSARSTANRREQRSPRKHADRESHTMKQEMLINVPQHEECRIAIVEDGVLEEL